MKRLAAPKGSSIKADHKNIKVEWARNVHAHRFRDKVLNTLQNPATKKDQRKLLFCVETFTTFRLESARIKDRDHQITCLKEEITLLKDLGSWRRPEILNASSGQS